MYEYQIKNENDIKTAVILLNESEQGGSAAMDFTSTVNECVENGAKKIMLNFENVRIMNSTGLGMLVGAYSNLKTRNIDMELHKVSDKILKIIKSTKLDKVFKVIN